MGRREIERGEEEKEERVRRSEKMREEGRERKVEG